MKALLLVVIFIFPWIINAQEVGNDTLKGKLPLTHFFQIINGTYADTLTSHVWLIGNPDCHRCLEVKEKLDEAKIPYIEYDVRDPEIMGIAYELVRKYEKSDKIAFSYPLVVVNHRVYYNIPDINVMVKEIKKDAPD